MECGRLASAPLGDETIVPMRLRPGVQAEAFGPDGAALPPGTPGRLRYRGPGTVARYEDDPALTSAHFADGWFQSGDFGTVSADGLLSITGREAELINSGGVKVAPVVIEEVLLTLRGVTEAVAFGAPDALGVEQIWAAFTATRLIGQQELTNHCGPALGAQAPPPRAAGAEAAAHGKRQGAARPAVPLRDGADGRTADIAACPWDARPRVAPGLPTT